MTKPAMDSEPVTLAGACHCRAEQFTARLTQGLASARRCTCSICRMRGAIAVTWAPADFEVIEGADTLATYRFGTMVADHHFCTCCGIYAHRKRRSNRNLLGVNVACLEGPSPFDFDQIPVNDGERHPSDNSGHVTCSAGILRFEAASDA